MGCGRSLTVLLLALSCTGAGAQDISDLLESDPADTETVEGPAIATETSADTDQAIKERLDTIFRELEDLKGIRTEVTSGVVTLSGEAASSTAADRARALARQVESVVEVVDDLTVDQSVGRRLGNTIDKLLSSLQALVAALPTLALALLVVALFWWLAKGVARRAGLFRGIAPNVFIAELLAATARVLLILFGIVLALSLLDATSIIGTVLGAAGIVGLAVGFAVRDTVENYIASILLSLRNPFRVRDFVAINDIEGNVARLTSRATILISVDGNHIRIPNAIVFKAVIVNYSRNPRRRFEFTVGVDTDLALQPAQALARQTVLTVKGVLDDPPAVVLVEALGDSNVSLSIQCWIDQRHSDLLKVRSEAIRLVKRAFDEAGIVMPEPIYRVRLQTDGVSPAIITGEGEAQSGGQADGPSPDAKAAVAAMDDAGESADTASEQDIGPALDEEIAAAGGENLLDDRARHE